MKRRYFILALLLALLSGCGPGRTDAPPAQPTPTPAASEVDGLLRYPLYSVSLGWDPENAVTCLWAAPNIVDDVFTLTMGEDDCLQLTGLNDVDGVDYDVTDCDDLGYWVVLKRQLASVMYDKQYLLSVEYRAGDSLAEQAYYAAPGGTVLGEDGTAYQIYEQSGDRVIFSQLAWRDESFDLDLYQLNGAYAAEGGVLLLTCIESVCNYSRSGPSTLTDYDVVGDAELRARWTRRLDALRDRVRLAFDLSPAELAAVLPDTLALYGGEGYVACPGVSFPCERLLHLGADEETRTQSVRFLSPEADGGMTELALYDAPAMEAVFGADERTLSWAEAYGQREEDAGMTARLGMTAMRCGEGWALCPGKYRTWDDKRPYYLYMTVEKTVNKES